MPIVPGPLKLSVNATDVLCNNCTCRYHLKHYEVCQLSLHNSTARGNEMHWTLVGIAAVITVILFIAVIMCIIITSVLAKGVRFMILHFSASETDRANGEHGMMVHHTQQQEEHNEGTCTANSRHSSN